MCLPRLVNSVTVWPLRSVAASCGTRKSERVRIRPASASFIRLAASQTVSPSGTPTRYVEDARGSDAVEDRLTTGVVLGSGDQVLLAKLLELAQSFGGPARRRRGRCSRHCRWCGCAGEV